MSLNPQFLAIVLIAAAAGVGAGWRGLGAPHPDPGARETLPKADYFGHARSFSELENARSELDATALRVLFELRRMRVESRGRAEGSAPDADLAKVIEVLEQGLKDLEGTEWEATVTRDLLVALKQAGHAQRWLEVYLDSTYRRPTSDIPPVYAAEAIRVGRILGREEEAITALHYVLGNPRVGEGRSRIAALFAEPTREDSRDADRKEGR